MTKRGRKSAAELSVATPEAATITVAAFPSRVTVVDEGDRLELRVWRGGDLVAAVPLDARRAARLAADLATAAARRMHGGEGRA